MVRAETRSTFHDSGRVELSPDEWGHRACGTTTVTLTARGCSYDITHCASEGAAAHWLASSVVGRILPPKDEEVDLGPVQWTSQKGRTVCARLVGLIGPAQLRAVFRYGYREDGNTMCLPEDAAAGKGWRLAAMVHESVAEDEQFASFGARRYAIPAFVRARITAFLEAALGVLPEL